MDAERTQQPLTLIFVHPNELHAYWGYVKPRLDIVKKKTSERWLPEDIYNALKTASATLFIGQDEDDYEGFVICEPLQDYDGKILHLWVLYSEEHNDVLQKYEPEIVEMARNIGAKRVRFYSPREWGKRIAPYGYVSRSAIFEKEV